MAREAEQSVKYNELAVAKIARSSVTKQTEWLIEGVQGLRLVVRPSGAASWLVQYQTGKGRKDRKRVRTTIGRYGDKLPALGLAEARAKANEITQQIAEGVDPVAENKAREGDLTLRQLFEARLAGDKGTAERTLEDYRSVLERDVLPRLGDKPANAITPEQLALVLEGVEHRAKHAAHKARSALGSTYKWGMRQWSNGRRLVTLNPVVSIGFTHQSKRRKRVLTDVELANLWHAIGATETVSEPTRNIIRLAILTAQRNSEVAGMEVAELKGLDSATPRWDIPARRMKRKSDDQYVPLSKQAAAVVRESQASSSNGVHVFEGTTHGRFGGTWRQDHIGQETVSRAVARIRETAGLKDVVLHDMRKCVTSWLAEHGHATPEVLDAILHHGRKGVTGTHYNFALYERQVRKALQSWADHVWQITGQAERAAAGNVVTLADARAG